MRRFKITKPKKPWVRVSFFLLVIALVFSGCEYAGWPFLRMPLVHFLETTLHRSVQIDGSFQLKLLRTIRLQAEHVRISAPDGFAQPYFLDAHALSLKLRYKDILNVDDSRAYRVQAVYANDLDIKLERLPDGRATWVFETDATRPERPFPAIEVLMVETGQIAVDDAYSASRMHATFQTREGQKQAVPYSNIHLSGTFKQQSLEAELHTAGFLPVATQTASSPPINSRGWLQYGGVFVQFHGSIFDLFGDQHIQGSVLITGKSLADAGDLMDITLPRTAAFKISANIEKKAQVWAVDVPAAQVGESILSGQFTYHVFHAKPELQGILKSQHFVLADLLPAFGGNVERKKITDKKHIVAPARLFPDQVLDFSSYDRMNAEVDIQFERVNLGRIFQDTIAPLNGHLSLLNGKLSLTQLNARTAHGSLAGNFSIDAHRKPVETTDPGVHHTSPDWNMHFLVSRVLLERLLKVSRSQSTSDSAKSAVHHSPEDARESAYLRGLLFLRTDLHGKGHSVRALLSTLDGKLALMVQGGEISRLMVEAAGLDVAQSVGLLIQGDHNIPMQCVAMDWRVAQGILKPEVAIIDTKVTSLLVQGQADLGRELLHLQLNASPKNFSPLTVRSPIYVRGTFLQPEVSINKGPVAARITGSILLALLNPLAAILPFLDPGSTETETVVGCQKTVQRLNLQSNHPIR